MAWRAEEYGHRVEGKEVGGEWPAVWSISACKVKPESRLKRGEAGQPYPGKVLSFEQKGRYDRSDRREKQP